SDLIPRIARSGDLPLSFAQQRLWFLDSLQPGNTGYNLLFGARLKGRLNEEALLRSLQEITRRHEILRTTFHDSDGVPHQRIAENFEFPVEKIDLRALKESARQEQMLRQKRELAEWPFDLRNGPLARAKMIWHAECEHLLIIALHHIVCDGWSIGLLISELKQLYEAYSEGKPSPLADPEIQYADYAAWQRDSFRDELPGPSLGY